MKYIYHFILLAALTLLVSSCSHFKNVIVHGTPGTDVYTPDKSWKGKIGPDGTAKLKLTSEYCYYLSKAPNSDLYIPFAIDVRDGEMDNVNFAPIISLTSGFLLPIGITIAACSQVDKPIKEQMTNNDLFAQYEDFYRQYGATQQPAVTTTNNGSVSFHQVKSGDSLGGIAKQYEISIEQLCQLNGISTTTPLHIGQMLKVR